MASAAHYRARIAANSRRKSTASPHDLAELRRDYAAAKLAENLEKWIATAPPLTEEQKQRLASIVGAVPVHS